MPIDAGSCNTHVELWAFDSKAGKCVSFKYRGCQGNGNKFYSQKECEEYCGVMKDGKTTHTHRHTRTQNGEGFY